MHVSKNFVVQPSCYGFFLLLLLLVSVEHFSCAYGDITENKYNTCKMTKMHLCEWIIHFVETFYFHRLFYHTKKARANTQHTHPKKRLCIKAWHKIKYQPMKRTNQEYKWMEREAHRKWEINEYFGIRLRPNTPLAI